MSFVNQYSYLLLSVFALIVVAVVLIRRQTRRSALLIALGGIALLLTASFFALRPGFSDVTTVAAADALISNGSPTLIEFYSNYCLGCLAVRPEVDALIADIRARYPDSFDILRIDIHTDFGAVLRERYDFTYTPEFVLLDARGGETWRGHVPPALETLDRVAFTSP
ncbi:MAG: hypothetical protein GYB67_18020, partial [Chloroflexi bacterium]|nr:hypothetical protein [Chloroflexota bacterium]